VIFAFARGIGNISSGPISDALLTHNRLAGAKLGYGVDNYVRTVFVSSSARIAYSDFFKGSLLLYTGLMMVAGSVVGVSYRDRPATARRERVQEVQ
jgi:hypothetical protein